MSVRPGPDRPPTAADILFAHRADIVAIPLAGLPPVPLGLIWCTAHENAQIRALAATGAAISPRLAALHPPGPGASRQPDRITGDLRAYRTPVTAGE